MSTQVKKTEKQKEQAFSTINTSAFFVVAGILVAILLLSGFLSYIVPQGAYARDEAGVIILDSYAQAEISGIAFWRVLTAPVRVFATSDGVTIIAISAFLLIMSGIFNLLEKTGGIKTFIVQIMKRLRDKNGPVICITVLIFMLFGSLFGMFEELVTLLPLIIVFMLSMQMDTMMGLGACLLASCFGLQEELLILFPIFLSFSKAMGWSNMLAACLVLVTTGVGFTTATFNPFTVGIASDLAGISVMDGLWYRAVIFGVLYILTSL